jgi:hypothetical protein
MEMKLARIDAINREKERVSAGGQTRGCIKATGTRNYSVVREHHVSVVSGNLIGLAE